MSDYKNKFMVYSKGNKIFITIGILLTEKGYMPKFEIHEVKKNSTILAVNTTCNVLFTAITDKVVLGIRDCGNLDISKNQKLIDWLYEESKFDSLYEYTSEYKNNWED